MSNDSIPGHGLRMLGPRQKRHLKTPVLKYEAYSKPFEALIHLWKIQDCRRKTTIFRFCFGRSNHLAVRNSSKSKRALRVSLACNEQLLTSQKGVLELWLWKF